MDRLWAKVALATVRGELGCASKVLVTKGKKTKKGQDSWKSTVAICVFTFNFNDRIEVKRILLNMEAMGLKMPSRFLPDIHV